MNQLKQADINGLLEMVELRESREQMVGSLSGGQKRRLSLLVTILNHPKLIFLDEPTTGMDLEAVDNFWKLLEQQEFTSVVVTHDFNQIDAFLQKVLILKMVELLPQSLLRTFTRLVKPLSSISEKR